jgi:3-hydroxyisobutyrate dehydrogenase
MAQDRTVGFVGTGTIGRPLVESMLRAGLRPVVHDVDPEVVAALAEQGAQPAADVADLARRANVVGICVPADAHVRAVLDGDAGLLANLEPGSVVAIHSTVSVETIEQAAEAAARHGVRIVEACLTGGPRAAAAGTTTFLLGGDEADIAALEPLLDACGEVRVHAGPLGAASRLKLCLNLQTYVTQAGIAEAVGLAHALDVPLDGLKSAMRANGQLGDLAASFFSLHELPESVIDEPSVLAFRTAQQKIVAKDMGLMGDVSRREAVDIGLLEAARSRFERTYRLPWPE